MNPRRKKRLTIVVSILIAIGIITSLVLYALSQNIDLFYTPSEIINGKDDTGKKPSIGQRIRVGGLVVPGSVKRDQDSLKVQFDLTNKGETITVKYDGILPDLFREGQGIIANGVLSESTLIQAHEVLAKHDENYMPKEIADSLGEGHQKPTYSAEQLKKNGY
ncbi:cytochrome c maturation protein CcmE [Thalassotalea ganghwensis]